MPSDGDSSKGEIKKIRAKYYREIMGYTSERMNQQSSKTENFKRKYWIDWAKSICIILMVVGHTSNVDISFKTFFYYFHMPVFFIIAGYLYKQSNIKEFCKTLLLPVLWFNLLNYPFYLYCLIKGTNELTIYTLLIQPALGLFFHIPNWNSPCGVFWFVVVIFIQKTIYSYIENKNFLKWIICFTCIVLAFIFKEHLNDKWFFLLQKSIVAFPFFFAGIFMKQLNIEKIFNNNIILISTIIISTITLILIVTINGKVDLYDGYLGNSVWGYYAGGVIGMLLIISLCMILAKITPTPAFITNISNGTLVVMGLHTTVIPILESIVRHHHFFYNDGIIKALIAISIIYLPMILIESRIPFLIGKTKKKYNV